MVPSVLNLFEQLMQPGGSETAIDMSWHGKAKCQGDLRFSSHKPDEELTEELTEICLNCPVFTRCMVDLADSTSVFVAGEWKEDDEDHPGLP
ncbi:WhiB family transcription factor [Mycobacterium phage Goldilocks]|nr:WhiB family transcription factor [Mycobacterium phage Goldilocks]